MIRKFLAWLRSRFLRHDSRFPRKVIGHWYCGCWYLHLADQIENGENIREFNGEAADKHSPADGKVAFNHYRCGIHGTDKTGLICGLIPAIRFGQTVGLYRVTRGSYQIQAFYDGAIWDDGGRVDLEFVKTCEVVRAGDE